MIAVSWWCARRSASDQFRATAGCFGSSTFERAAAGHLWSAIDDAPGSEGVVLVTYWPNCRMTPDQVKNWGKALAPYGCFFMMWRYDKTYMSKTANQDAFKAIGEPSEHVAHRLPDDQRAQHGGGSSQQ